MMSFLQNKATEHASPETRDLNPLSVVTLDIPVLNKPLFLQEAHDNNFNKGYIFEFRKKIKRI